MKWSLDRGRSSAALLGAALALSASVAIHASESPGHGPEGSVEAATGKVPDFGLERVHRTADATDRTAKQPGASAGHGVRPTADAVQRGNDRAGKAAARPLGKKASVIRQHHSMLAPPP